MKKFCLLVVLSCAFISLGCPVRSLNSLFTEKEFSFNPSLVGAWKSHEETYEFRPSTEKSYQLVVASESEPDSFSYTVLLGKIGTNWFLDSYPLTNSDEYHYLSTHIFSRIKLQGDTLRLAILEGEWLSKMIEKKEVKIPHVRRESDIILSASSKELQALFLKYGGNNEAFPIESAFIRLRP